LPRLAHALFRAYWVEDRDINDKATLQSIADGAGLDGVALLARTADPEIKAQLLENTSGTVRRGVYGAPSFFVGDELFFGQDRLDQVAEAL
jgi:2-hydroxychromene-2-carboxylate isomerase